MKALLKKRASSYEGMHIIGFVPEIRYELSQVLKLDNWNYISTLSRA